jgi:hypothetical protein
MHGFLHALQGGQRPGGTRRELVARFGDATVDGLIACGLLVPGPRAAEFPCPRVGDACPREVIDNPGDPVFPFVAVPPGVHCCDAVRLTAGDIATWATSRQRLVALVAELFRVRGPANLRDEVFPCAHRLGRAPWRGQEREVLLCTNLNGAAPLAFLLARKAQRQPTLVVAHARTRFTSPDLDAHFGAGEVAVVFLEDELELVGGRVQRRREPAAREPIADYGAPAFCVLVNADGARQLDEAAYRDLLASAHDLDLFLDLTRTGSAGRHPTGRREADQLIAGSLTPQQAAAYAELMERQQPLRAGELRALRGVNHPDKLIEAARRELDVKLSRYDWRATQLLRGDTPETKRYWFRPPEGLRWALVRPLRRGASAVELRQQG